MTTISIKPGSPYAGVVECISRVCQCSIPVVEDPAVATVGLVAEGKAPAMGLAAVALELVERNGVKDKKWKNTFVPQKELPSITQYLQIATEIAQSGADKNSLGQIQTVLREKTFLVGNDITIADVALFAVIYPALQNMTEQEQYSFCNVLRWAAHIHYLIHSEMPPLVLPEPDISKQSVKKEKKPKQGQQKPE